MIDFAAIQGPTVIELSGAGHAYAQRKDAESMRLAAICEDMADKLDINGRFLSDKQQAFAAKLVRQSKTPVQASTPAVPVAPSLFPKIRAIIMDGATLYFPTFKATAFRSGAVAIVSPVFGQAIYGFLEEGGRLRTRNEMTPEILAQLKAIEANPLEEVKRMGRETGQCCMCGLKLTDPVSVANGIGPICAGKL
jgi:hypothetical protein